MKRIIAIVMLAAVSQAADVVLGKLSDLSWTGTGGDKVAAWGSADVLDGLVAWWKFDEASYDGTDGEIADSSGNGNVGTTQHTVSSAAGKIRNAASFGVPEGENGFAGCQKSTFPVTTNISLSCWIRSTRKSFAGTVFMWGLPILGTDRIFGVRLDDGAILCEIGASSYQYFYQTGSKDYTDNEWHHISLVYDGIKCKLYIDGAFNAEVNATGALNMSGSYTDSLLIGGTGSYFFHGLIDDMRIYNRALSSNEVSTIYNLYK